MQQLTGALGGYVVGLLPHHDALPLSLAMLSFALLASWAMRGTHPQRPAPPPRRVG
jgi:heme A synthase